MIEPGARFKKVWGDKEDRHTIGSTGKVLERVGPVQDGEHAGEYVYIVSFDGDPAEIAIFIRGKKIEEIK